MNLMVALQLAQIGLWILVIRETRKRRRLLKDAGSVLWNMPEVDHDPDWERRATAVMQRIDDEVGLP